MYDFEVKISKTEKTDTHIKFKSYTIELQAEDEEEARLIVEENEPEFNIDSIKKVSSWY